ncbi:membrane protein [Microbacterium phage Nucci]|nr:membrane protein [Microbacterium phage Nucci]QXO13618.1 membrane protein [Microbacterium phage Mandalorian]
MLEVIERIGAVLTPLFVAVITVYGGVMVAKINKVKANVEKVQSDIITNHGSKNIGDAIDRLTTRVMVISDNQDQLILDVKALKAHDAEVDTRLDNIDKSSQDTKDAVSDTIRVVKPFHALVDKLKGK